MTAVAFGFNEKEIILPELAALSIGFFMHKKNELTDNPVHLFLLPSLTAFLGFFINQPDINLEAKIVLVLTGMFMLLHFIKSSLAPALATGLLPIITNCNSYIFLISIIVFMGTLGVLVEAFFRSENLEENKKNNRKPLLSAVVLLAVLIMWTIICAAAGNMQMAAIPPVIVLGFESINKKHYTLKMSTNRSLRLYQQRLLLHRVFIIWTIIFWQL